MPQLPDNQAERARAMAAHPSAQTGTRELTPIGGRTPSGTRLAEEDGSLVTEYGLLAVVAATVAGVVIQWASGGALVTLFNALLRHARSLVGA